MISARKLLLQAVNDLHEKSIQPVGVSAADNFMVRAVSITLPNEEDWLEACSQHMQAEVGKGFGYTP